MKSKKNLTPPRTNQRKVMIKNMKTEGKSKIAKK